jgi:hypothetical protein
MLSDMIAYAPLASAFLVTGLRLFFEKPNRCEIPFSRPSPDQLEHHPESSSVDA